MTFISYAQNFEDVMLWRALKHVPQGFYIDVGANHPSDDSVTKAFYDRGWSGINIEPLALHIAQLQDERPRDINLHLAAGASSGEIEIFETDIRGLATASAAVAEMHQRQGRTTAGTTVPLRRLAEICAEHAQPVIHFLKIDVEGFEDDVLRGMDFQRFRPWIVVVEATIPNSQDIDTHWEPHLLSAHYHGVYFDGLNRYYLAAEHPELEDAFSAPPNVFDAFIPAEVVRLEQLLQAAHAATAQEACKVEEQKEKVWKKEEKIRALEAQLEAVYASTSWRLTAPLRSWVNDINRQKDAVRAFPKFLKNFLIGTASRLLARHPRLRRLLGRLTRVLGIHQRLQALQWQAQGALAWAGPQLLDAQHRLHPAALALRPLVPEALFLPSARPPLPWTRLVGHAEGHYSLAIVNRGLGIGLEQLSGGQFHFTPYHGQAYDHPSDLPANQLDLLKPAFSRQLPATEEGSCLSIVHHYPLITDPEAAGQRFVLFFWEETTIPAATIAHLNHNFDAVLAATTFVKRALLNSGCRLPVFVIPIGIDHLIDADQAPIGALPPEEGRPFRFLHLSSVFERKGPDVLLAAYFDRYSAQDPVELYIKTFPNPHNRIREQLAALQAERSDAPKVVIDETPLDDGGMLALYRSSQALVLPTRGEGFNLPAAEAMALGLPVIVTGHGAHTDFCALATANLIPFHFSASRSHVKAGDACWVEPDYQALGLLMGKLQQRILARDPLLEAQRQAAREHVVRIYNWQESARAVLASAQWLKTQPRPSPARLALLSPWATRCGIAEYSKNLLKNFHPSPDYRLQVYCDHRTAPAPDQDLYTPCWSLGNPHSVADALERIREDKPDILLLQHQPSLFPLDDAICRRLKQIADTGCVVAVELHSTLPLLYECRVSEAALADLRQVDRIIVHKPEDLNHLLALGLVDNVMLLNHGVPQPLATPAPEATRQQLAIPHDALVLGCFGFVLPHKGIDTLVEAIRPLEKASRRPVHLIALNSILDERSEQTLRQYQARARQLGVDRQITWISDYRPIGECQRLLGAADYILFPYKETRESASGAVTIGLASLKPVLVSPLPIFSDLAEVTWQMDGGDTADIVAAIQTLEKDPAQAAALLARQAQWLAERDWTRISERLDGCLTGLRWHRALARDLDQARQQEFRTLPPPPPAQLLVDVSEIYFRDARTGIQRVVRSVLQELLAHPPAGYQICPVYARKGEDYRYTARFQPGQPPALARDEQPVDVRPGDIFLGLDLTAHLFPEVEPILNRYRAAGVRIHYVVYDIIPLLHPRYTSPGITQAFEHWLHGLARHADSLIGISAAVADELRQWLRQNSPALPLPEVRHFHLGADIDNSAPSTGLPDNAATVLEHIGAATAFLMVGTIEPRKGQAQALEAFELLWRSGLPCRLVLVGKEGWMMADFVARLREHPELGKRLFWLEAISDEYLERVYQACDCLIAASETEGFGLPLIEAAQHGLPIIARDIPVFREIAGKHAYYFSGQEARALTTALHAWLELHAGGHAPASTALPWLTWQESTAQLARLILHTGTPTS